MTFYVAKSSAYKNIYPENKNHGFKFQLLRRGEYNYTCLHELIIPPIESSYIVRAQLNVVSHTQIGERSSPLLRLISVQASDKTQIIQFPVPQVMKIACPLFDELSLSLVDDITGKLITFPDSPPHDTYALIEFKK
jgi:hypothetical protein